MVEVDLAVPRPFDAPGVFRFLAQRAIRGVEVSDDDGATLRYARTTALPSGPGAVEVVADRTGPGAWRATARVETSATTPAAREQDVAVALAALGRLLDLRTDPRAVDAALAGDPHLAPFVAGTPGIRVPGVVDAPEYVVRAIVGQQITVAAARTHLSRLAQRFGTPYASTVDGLTTVFPTPATLAEHLPVALPGTPEACDPERPLRLPARVVGAVVAACRAMADGDLVLDHDHSPAEFRAALLGRPGIGVWTAEYLAARVVGDPDAWPVGDVALLAGASAAGLPLDHGAPAARRHQNLAAHARRWAPWRSYAALHLWAARGSQPRITDPSPKPTSSATPTDTSPGTMKEWLKR